MPDNNRHGVVLVVMLVLLTVVMMFAASWASRIVGERRHVRRQLIATQAIRLAESGVSRGEALLAADSAYRGERWVIPAKSWEAGRGARVEIRVEPDQPITGSARITARATYPLDDVQAVQRTLQTIVRLHP
jgi:Tfp pilus assembly protein PilX